VVEKTRVSRRTAQLVKSRIVALGAGLFFILVGLGCVDCSGGPGPGPDGVTDSGPGSGVLDIIDEGFGDGGRPIVSDVDASVADDSGFVGIPGADGGMP
jgi:hypothetical protein